MKLGTAVLDLTTVFLTFQSEEQDRSIFDTLFKAKKDILKFKTLLTQFLPIQMVIFSKGFTKAFYINNMFSRTFKCKDKSGAKVLMEKMIIEKEAISKEKETFESFGYPYSEESAPLSLSKFMETLSHKYDLLKEIGNISYNVIEEENRNDSLQILLKEENPTTTAKVASTGDEKKKKSQGRRKSGFSCNKKI